MISLLRSKSKRNANSRSVMRGKRKRLNQVNEAKMIAGVSWCPVPAYTRKAATDAIVGRAIATPIFPARISSIFRT